jgi:WW domain-containing oxidoreductase
MNKKTTYTDPRLAFAVEDTENTTGKKEFRQRYDAASTGMQVLLGRDLSKHYYIVTGGNSGLGNLYTILLVCLILGYTVFPQYLWVLGSMTVRK